MATATKGVLQTAASMQQRANIDITGILCYDPLRSKSYHDLMGLMKKSKKTNKHLITMPMHTKTLLFGRILRIIIIVPILRGMGKWFQ